MIGVPRSDPKTPGFVMVKVPSSTSFGWSRLVRARDREIGQRSRESDERERAVGPLDHWNDQPPVERDGDPDVVLPAQDHVVAAHRGVDRRMGS